jgi:hypothetical protein
LRNQYNLEFGLTWIKRRLSLICDRALLTLFKLTRVANPSADRHQFSLNWYANNRYATSKSVEVYLKQVAFKAKPDASKHLPAFEQAEVGYRWLKLIGWF